MFFVDTNVWLERLLQQEHAEEAISFFSAVHSEDIYLSDLGLHPIGIILYRFGKKKAFEEFIKESFIDYSTNIVSLPSHELNQVTRFEQLDFEDAYQAVVSAKYHLQLVSYDKDFSKQGILTLSPAAALIEYKMAKQI